MKTKELDKEKYERFADIFEASIDERVDYECNHDDAGGNYSHLPRDGGWIYSNGDDRLKAWLKENDIKPPADFDRFADDVLDQFEIEAGHIFSNPEGSGSFVVDSFPVGEVEDQYCIEDLASLLETDIETAKQFAIMAMDDNRFCLNENGDGGLLSYTSTDATWNFTITKEAICDILEDINA